MNDCIYLHIMSFESNIFFKTSHWLSKSASFELRIKTHLSIQYFILIWHNNPHNEGVLFWNKQEKMYYNEIFYTVVWGQWYFSQDNINNIKSKSFWGCSIYMQAEIPPRVHFFTQTKTCRIVLTLLTPL